MTVAPQLSAECRSWIQTAGYRVHVDDDSATTALLSHGVAAPTRYHVRRRDRGRLSLTQLHDDDEERLVVFAADQQTLERYLFGMFGDDIREDLALPFLDLPWTSDALAPGYTLTEPGQKYRTLISHDHGPVAAAPESPVSLLTLVPLSQFLRISLAELKQSFLDAAGSPLLIGRRYSR